MVSVEHLTQEFSSKPILDDISFLVGDHDKIALVGKNGAGKTTLLRLIAGEMQPTAGKITRSADLQIGYLPQHLITTDESTLRNNVLSAFSFSDASEQSRFVAQMDRVLTGLGFRRDDFERQCTEFSGGWRMRIELAKILLRQPQLLLLDEPTNHLDIESIQWLEDFLRSSNVALLLVSHDRAFIDNATNRTIEISLGRIYDYNVNYSHFVELRRERHEQQVRAYQNQQKMIRDTEDFIERFRYKATKAVQVQSRIKQLERLERLEVDLEDTSRLRLRFPPAPRSGDFPIIADTLSKSFGEHLVFSDVNYTIRRGEKVAFVGRNGEGKTTMVRCIMQQLDYEGTLKIGHNVKIGYFAQNQAALLDGELTVFQTIDNVAKGDIRTKIRDILGAFMFGGEASDKKVKVLSGGERSRLAMIRLLLEEVNLLILDEPTNHLDMPSKDVLKDALRDFDGTLICVSHDRDFLDGLVSKVYEFAAGRVIEHLGGIYDFLQHKKIDSLQQLERRDVTTESKVKNTTQSKLDFEEQKQQQRERRKREKQIEQIEKEIAALEQEQHDIEQKLSRPDAGTDTQLYERYEHVKHAIEQKLYEWEILSED